jgi:DNA polymerase III sliding clamp (beta) subunit (PCNA family)
MSKISALQGILVKDNSLIANDLEMLIKTKIEGAEGESFIIPERALTLINNLPDGEIEITADSDNTVVIKSDKIKNTYRSFSPQDFPLPELEGEKDNQFTIKSSVLLESIKRVSYAVAEQSPHPVLQSLLLRAEAMVLNFVGVDGHVIAWDRVDYDGEFELLIPKSAINRFQLLGLTGDVSIKFNANGALFSTNECEIYTRLSDGEFVEYRRLFDKLPLHTYLARTEMLDAVVRAKACAKDRIPVRFEIEDDVLHISLRDEATDYHEMVYLAEKLTEKLVIYFDAKLVIETLKAFDCENIGLQFAGPKYPMIIEAEDSDFKALVLPVAVKE